jgi:hypothetical protein
MPGVGFEPTAPVFECVKTVHALGRSVTVIGITRRDSVVGTVTGYGLGDRVFGVRVPVGSKIFTTSSRPALGSTQPPIQWVPGMKLPGPEASPPASAEVKKMRIYTSTSSYAFMA